MSSTIIIAAIAATVVVFLMGFFIGWIAYAHRLNYDEKRMEVLKRKVNKSEK